MLRGLLRNSIPETQLLGSQVPFNNLSHDTNEAVRQLDVFRRSPVLTGTLSGRTGPGVHRFAHVVREILARGAVSL